MPQLSRFRVLGARRAISSLFKKGDQTVEPEPPASRADRGFAFLASCRGHCGSDRIAVSNVFEQEVLPGSAEPIYTPALADNGLCFSAFFGIPYECSNRGSFNHVRARNEVAP
jgi:hypothetical protein